MKDKKIQVPERFFNTVVQLLEIIDRTKLTPQEWELILILQHEVEAKADAQKRRELFTAYKTAKPGTERDGKRIDYLTDSGVSHSFRSDKELPEKTGNYI